MNKFVSALEKRVNESIHNNFGIENYDEDRFGKYIPETQIKRVHTEDVKKFKGNLKKIIKKIIRYQPGKTFGIHSVELVKKYEDRLNCVYELVNPVSQKLLVDIVAYRILGYKKIKLPLNNSEYRGHFNEVKLLMNENDTIDPKFMHFILRRFNLNPLGYNIDLYFTEAGVVTDFIIEQYAYKLNDRHIVNAEPGDVVLDIGGCWGDTALYFAHKVGENGEVFSFEFIPNNIKIHKLNTGLNTSLEKRIHLVENPVSEIAGQTIYYIDKGPGSFVYDKPFENQTGSATSISVDDFVNKKNISKVDFIKMDIEGSEPMALKGAINTIKKFRPKLAISIYHSMDDFVNIPLWLNSIDVG
ncbi:MAG: FkbM family methyltransferase, partial [Ginsengibacter sp.]